MSVLHSAKVLLGKALRPFHAGVGKLTGNQPRISAEPDIALRSSVFGEGDPIPKRYAGPGEGRNVSPPLEWSEVPAGTVELLLLVEDPDAPFTQPYIHWLLYKIPAGVTALPEGVEPVPSLGYPPGARQGQNSSNTIGYTGPLPPPAHGVHHYHFQLFALDAALALGPNPTRRELLEAMSNHVLGQGELIGTYERS